MRYLNVSHKNAPHRCNSKFTKALLYIDFNQNSKQRNVVKYIYNKKNTNVKINNKIYKNI